MIPRLIFALTLLCGLLCLMTAAPVYATGGRVVQRQRIVTRTPLVQRQRIVVRQQVVAAPVVAPLIVHQPVQAFVQPIYAAPIHVPQAVAAPQVQFFSSATTGCAAFFSR